MEKLREEIDSKYKWDLSDYYKNDNEFYKDCEALKKDIDELEKYKGTITSNGQKLFEFLEKKSETEVKAESIYVYGCFFRYHPNTADSNGQKAKDKSEDVYRYYAAKTSFVETELLKGDFKKLIKEEPKLKKYQYYLELIERNRAHTLSEKEELLLAKASDILGASENIYDCIMYSDVDYGKIKDEKGNLVELSDTNYEEFLRSDNRNLRKRAYSKKTQYYEKLKNTTSYTYKGTIKEAMFLSDVRNFSSPLEMNLFYNQISDKAYNNLLNVVGSNTKDLQDFIELKRKLLGIPKFHMYDMSVSPKLKIKDKITYEEATNKIINALEVMGEDYVNTVKTLLENNMIDVFPNKGKYSGGYQVGSYGHMPRILYNYTDTFVDFYGLIHEIGHAMHTNYSNKNQPYFYSNYNLMLAETASLTNEVILTNYLLDSAETKDEKIFYLLNI